MQMCRVVVAVVVVVVEIVTGNNCQSTLKSLAEEKTPIQSFLINSQGTSRSPLLQMSILTVTR